MKRSDFLRITTTGLASQSVLGMWMVDLISGEVSAAETPSNLRPYLQTVRPNSAWVSWWSNTAATTFVDWGTSPEALTNTATGGMQNLGTNYRYHSAQLTGLTPNTFYHYQVRTDQETSAVFRFRTPPPAGTKTGRFRVLVIGDNQILTTEQRWAKLVEKAKTKIESKYGVPIEEAVDFVLNVGDQVDVGTLEHYRYLHFDYSKLISPNLGFMTMIGNHETYTDTNLTLYKNLFYYDALTYQGIASPLPEVYYAHQLANILFIHLSSEHTGTTQQNWVQSLVTAAKADTSVDFIISLCHRPYQAEQYVGDISSWFRTTVMPILSQTEKHVLTIGAHHHLYARGQTRDWPTYHIISGATAWDQYWGQSTETDFDDVQKTIANWAWQILDFDLPNRRMDVEVYAEANVRFAQADRWTTRAYNSRLIDSFHRQLGLAVPTTPSITNDLSAAITLPYVLQSSVFATTTTEVLNSVQFQVAQDTGFTNLKVDRIRDVENLYGDTGSPNYEPVNTHATVDITKWTLAGGSLPNGTYYARVRHRDANASWSAWSAAKSFTVQGSTTGSPKLTMAKKAYTLNEDFSVAFEFAPGNTSDWIGIYKKGQTPASATPSTTWAYLGGSQSVPSSAIRNGSILFTANIAVGEWFATMLASGGYTQVATPVPFFVGNTPTLATSKAAYNLGEAVQVNFSNAPGTTATGRNKDWIGCYRMGRNPNVDGTSPAWNYVTSATGSLSFSGLAKGYYYAVYMVNDAYFEISDRIPFSVGSEIATVTCPAVWNQGENLTVSFSDGPGIPKDYIGIFRAGSTPGVGAEGTLINYLYFNGLTAGSVTFQERPAPGEYYVGLFTNDSYTNVSNLATFTVPEPPRLALQNAEMSGGQMQLTMQTQAGKTYLVQRSTNLSDWETVQTVTGNGLAQTLTAAPNMAQPDRCFFRVLQE